MKLATPLLVGLAGILITSSAQAAVFSATLKASCTFLNEETGKLAKKSVSNTTLLRNTSEDSAEDPAERIPVSDLEVVLDTEGEDAGLKVVLKDNIDHVVQHVFLFEDITEVNDENDNNSVIHLLLIDPDTDSDEPAGTAVVTVKRARNSSGEVTSTKISATFSFSFPGNENEGAEVCTGTFASKKLLRADD